MTRRKQRDQVSKQNGQSQGQKGASYPSGHQHRPLSKAWGTHCVTPVMGHETRLAARDRAGWEMTGNRKENSQGCWENSISYFWWWGHAFIM